MFTLLEFLRVLFILVLGTGILLYLEIWLYSFFNVDLLGNSMGWLAAIANWIIVFIVYRNFLQFRGWDKSSNKAKISRPTTIVLIVVSAILFIIPLLNGLM